METTVDLAKKLAEALNWKLAGVNAVFEVSEDKQGFFVVKLQPKMFLDPADFRTVCSLTRDLGGDGEYVKATRSWKVPGPLAKKPASVQPKKSAEFSMVPLSALVSMPHECRTNADDAELAELTESIKTLGVLQPILVRPKPNGQYEVVYGQRRRKAAEKAGLHEIPANVRMLSDQEAYEAQFSENIQREDLSDMEKAHMLNFLIMRFGYTQEALAQKLGKTKGWVSQHISMLELEKVYPGKLQTGELTERQAREILAAPKDKQEKIIDEINKTGEVPSVRELHEIVHPTQTILCDECGEPVENPVHVEGKFYHADCYEKVKAEKLPSLIPETPLHFEPETSIEKEEPEKKPLRAVQIGEFECTECHQHFLVEHLPNGKHALRLVGEPKE